MALQFGVELLANRGMAVLDVEPGQTVPGGERGQWIAHDRVAFETSGERLEQRGECDRMLDREIEICGQRLVDKDLSMLSVPQSRTLLIDLVRGDIVRNVPLYMFRQCVAMFPKRRS